MPERCKFPLCKSWAHENGLCVSHGRVYGPEDLRGVKAPEAPKAKAVKKQSDKMKKALADLKKLVKKKLAEQPNCELKMEGCQGKAVTCHHSKGRVGKQLLSYKNLMSSCSHCNMIAEQKDSEARAKGIKKSQHKIEQ